MKLLSRNDYKAIQRAMDEQRTFRLEMGYQGAYRIEVLVEPAPENWNQPMLICVRQWRRREPDGTWSAHLFSTQNFRSVEQMQRILV